MSVADTDGSTWPAPRTSGIPREEASKLLFEGQVEARNKRIQEEIDTRQLHLQTDHTNLAAFHEKVGSLALASVERSRAGAETVQRAAAAIATLYAASLGLAFSVTSRPLPLRGILAPLFLGIAIVLASAYLAYVGPTDHDPIPAPAGGLAPEPRALARTRTLLSLVETVVDRRSYWLRASVIALGCGVLALPAPFLLARTGEPAVASAPDWPTAPDRTDRFGEILYQAEVAEVAAARMKAASQPAQDDWDIVLIGAVAGILVIAVGARALRRRLPD